MALIIDIEGVDGVGKGTQGRLLVDRLAAEGHKPVFLSFPMYESFFGKMVARYLNGLFGGLDVVPVEFATLLYALDRWHYFSKNKVHATDEQIIVIDRYVPSNLAHQGAKARPEQRQKTIEWIATLEYDILKNPRPDLVLVLDADINITSAQTGQKGRRGYTDKKLDLHEENKPYLEKVRDVFQQLCREDGAFRLVNCSSGGSMRSIPDIAGEIWRHVKPLISGAAASASQRKQ